MIFKNLTSCKKVSVFSEMLHCSSVYSQTTNEPSVVLPHQNEPGNVSGPICCITRTPNQNAQNLPLGRKKKQQRQKSHSQ